MNSKLKKLGLSDTKNQIKCHTPKRSTLQTPKDISSSHAKRQQPQLNPSLSSFKLNKRVDNEQLVLNILIGLIRKRQKQFCSIAGHDRNPIKYICLSQSCPKKLGCSYCILAQHKNHNNMEVKMCLNDLVELQQKVQVNREILITEILIKKEELLLKIEREISSIRSQFLNGMDYLNNRVRQSIQNKFKQAIASLSSNQSKPSTSKKVQQTFRQTHQNGQAANEDDNIISKFMLSEFKTQTKSTPKPKMQIYKHDYLLHSLKKEEEQHLLTKLSRLNITYIQEYLKQQVIQAKSFLTSFRIFEGYYTQLNSSILQMLASFKRAIPNGQNFIVGSVQPQILQAFTLLR